VDERPKALRLSNLGRCGGRTGRSRSPSQGWSCIVEVVFIWPLVVRDSVRESELASPLERLHHISPWSFVALPSGNAEYRAGGTDLDCEI
jgi:hypothetical protein